MGVDGFVFRKEWYDVMKGCSAEVRQEVYEAVMAYAFEDVVQEMGAMAQMAFAFIRPQVDAMREKYEAKCEQLRANASKCKQKQVVASENEQTQAIVSNKIKQDKIKQDKIKQESECDNNAPTHTLTHEEEIFNQFNEYCREVAPLAIAFKEPLSLKDFEWLYNTYGSARIKKCAEELHNKEAYKKNRRAITAWKAFISKIS